jgi:hypothetical protein
MCEVAIGEIQDGNTLDKLAALRSAFFVSISPSGASAGLDSDGSAPRSQRRKVTI